MKLPTLLLTTALLCAIPFNAPADSSPCPCGQADASSVSLHNPDSSSNRYVKLSAAGTSKVETIPPGRHDVFIPPGFPRNPDGTVTVTLVHDASGTVLPSGSSAVIDIFPGGSPVYYGPQPSTHTTPIGDGTGLGITGTATGGSGYGDGSGTGITVTATGFVPQFSSYRGYYAAVAERLQYGSTEVRIAPGMGKDSGRPRVSPAEANGNDDPAPGPRGPTEDLPKPNLANCEDLPETAQNTISGKLCTSASEDPLTPAGHDFIGGENLNYTDLSGNRYLFHNGGLVTIGQDPSSSSVTIQAYKSDAFVPNGAIPPTITGIPSLVYRVSQAPALTLSDVLGPFGTVTDSYLPEHGIRYVHFDQNGNVISTRDVYSITYAPGGDDKIVTWARVDTAPSGEVYIVRGISVVDAGLADRWDAVEEMEIRNFNDGNNSNDIRTNLRKERNTYTRIAGVGDRLVSKVIIPQTGEGLTTTYAWYDSGEFKGKRKLIVQPDGSWSADIYARDGWTVTHTTCRPWKDGPAAPAPSAVQPSLASTAGVASTVRYYIGSLLNSLTEKGPGGTVVTAKSEFAYATDADYEYVLEKRYSDATHFMSSVRATYRPDHTLVAARGRIALEIELKENVDLLASGFAGNPGALWNMPTTDLLRRSKYSYSLVDQSDQPQSLSAWSGQLFVRSVIIEDDTREPVLTRIEHREFSTGRLERSMTVLDDSLDSIAPVVLAQTIRVHDDWGRLTTVTENGIETSSTTYTSAPSTTSALLYGTTTTGPSGATVTNWVDYQGRNVSTVEHGLPATLTAGVPGWAFYGRNTATSYTARANGGVTTSVTISDVPFTETGMPGPSRLLSVTQTDMAGRIRSTQAAGESAITYSYSGLTTTVQGPVMQVNANGNPTGTVTGIHRKEVRYLDGRLSMVSGAKVDGKSYDYPAPVTAYVSQSKVTSLSAASPSGKFAADVLSWDQTTEVVTETDGLGRVIAETRILSPSDLTPRRLVTTYGTDGRLLMSEERTTGEVNAAAQRFRRQTRTWDAANKEWISESSLRIKNGAAETDYYPERTLSRLAYFAGEWTQVTRQQRKNSSSGQWETVATSHEVVGPWPQAGAPGEMITARSRNYRIDQLSGVGTPASTTVTTVLRALGKTVTTVTPDTAPASWTATWLGRTGESYDGSSGGTVRYNYTPLGELSGMQDPRTQQWSLTTYEAATGRRLAERPSGFAADQATYAWFPAGDWRQGLLRSVTDAAGKVTYYSYDEQGRTTHTWGSAPYPSRYRYDAHGRLTGLWTYQSGTWNPAPGTPLLPPVGFNQTGSLTQWTWHNATGLLTAKTYADAKQTLYSYWRDGSVAVRTWARLVGGLPLTTTYRWTDQAQLQQIDYSDTTPDVTFTWNAHNGSAATMTDTLGTHTYSVRTDGLLESETIATADGQAIIDPGWDAYRRRQTLVASYAGAATGQETRHYSTQGRLTYLVSDGRTTQYVYHPGLNRVKDRVSYSGVLGGGLTQVQVTSETLDTRNRIWVMTNRRSDAMGAPVFSSHTYTFDAANRRELAQREDGTQWDYDYNDRSEVTGAQRELSNGTLLAGTKSTYNYDAIGNRTGSTLNTSGGGPATASGTPADVTRSVAYTANALNQYTNLTLNERSFDVAGRYVYDPAVSGSTPAINGIAPYEQTISTGSGTAGTQLRHFRASLTASTSGNTTGNYENVNVMTAAGTVLEYSGLKWVPRTTTVPTYDSDGNLTNDGRWTYTWDAENRLKSMSHGGSVTPYVPALLVEFRYDGLSRRVEKKVSTFNGSIWIEQLRERTLYDGWNPIGTWRLQPPDAAHITPWWKLHQHYVWGPDVSGTEQGAGGVGGLAMIIGGSGGNWFPCYDGNGNITALVDAQPSGTVAAQYDYDAFGNPVRMSGPAARLNPFRFSTKFTDDETELVYYGYRYYDPGVGRWLNRDPIRELGGLNLYTIVANALTSGIDVLGRDPHELIGGSARDDFGKNSLYIGLKESGNVPLTLEVTGHIQWKPCLAGVGEQGRLSIGPRYVTITATDVWPFPNESPKDIVVLMNTHAPDPGSPNGLHPNPLEQLGISLGTTCGALDYRISIMDGALTLLPAEPLPPEPVLSPETDAFFKNERQHNQVTSRMPDGFKPTRSFSLIYKWNCDGSSSLFSDILKPGPSRLGKPPLGNLVPLKPIPPSFKR